MTKTKDMVLDEKTKIPLFAVIVALPILCGGVIWLTEIDAKASAAEKEQKSTREILERYQERLESIDNRLGHIEGALGK